VGAIHVNSGANQVASWINGSSQATIIRPGFGNAPDPGFSKFEATLGGMPFVLTPTTATDLSSLAAVLQQQFRAQDGGTDISVVVDGTDLQITDSQGRSFKNFALIPTSPTSLASGGKVEILNSNVSQTNVRAEVFSEVRVPVAQLNLAKQLNINNQVITGYKTVNQLVDKINASKAGVIASVEPNGEFLLKDPLGSPIRIYPTPDGNVLDIQPTTYYAQVRMVQVVRDMRVSAADIDFDKPLTINGLNLSEASYELPLNVPSSVEFGYPTTSVSASNPTNLVKALNSISSVSGIKLTDAAHTLSLELSIAGEKFVVDGINSPFYTQTIGFTAATFPAGKKITVAGLEITLPALPNASPLPGNGPLVAETVKNALLASDKFSGYTITRQNNELVLVSPRGASPFEFSTSLNIGSSNEDIDLTAGVQTITDGLIEQIAENLADNGFGWIDVKQENGALIFSNTSDKEVTLIALNSISTADPLITAKAGTIDKKFSESFVAAERDGAVVISSANESAVDSDITNSFVFKSQGNAVSPQKGITTLQGFVDRINSKAHQTGVVAELDLYGDLKLSTTDEKGTRDISIGPGKDAFGNQIANALSLESKDFDVTERLNRKLQDPLFISDIRVSFGSYGDPKKFGDPADLSKIGLRTGAYIEEGCPDELLLFVTGKGAAKVAAGFEGSPDNLRDSLRAQSFTVKFTAENRYTINDAATGTQLADRYYDPEMLEPVVDFQGLAVKLSHAPAVGDSYKIDGNFDGLGNNVNMLEMVDLNKKPTANGKTIANTYIDQINNVGNLAQQAIITQEALTVVNEQAIESRDKVSGVNLDDEAAALIRYQQAYQACAKALQVSGELFDSIIQIR
jgi:flagellar hook-associated protein FlgK